MNEDEITIFLTPIDVEHFKEFQKYYDIFNLLIEKNVFNQKSAAITLHFDNKGLLRNIARADMLYSNTSKFDNIN